MDGHCSQALLPGRRQCARSARVKTASEDTVYEQFFTTLPRHTFTPADVLDLYLHRGSFETVLADEDEEQATDRWVSRTQ